MMMLAFFVPKSYAVGEQRTEACSHGYVAALRQRRHAAIGFKVGEGVLRVTVQARKGLCIHWSAAPSVNAYLTAYLLTFLCTAPLDRSDADRERKAGRGERSKNPNG